MQSISEWVGFYDFSNETNNLLVNLQHSVMCYFGFLRHTQLCNNNFSPIVGNVTEHVDQVCFRLCLNSIEWF